MLERAFQKQVIKWLKSKGAVVYNIHGHAMQQRGIPDLYVAHWRWQGWLELKTGNNKLSTLQEIEIGKLQSRNVNALVLYPEDFQNFQKLLEHYTPSEN